jgi:YidC/Oxa1 family membrane protein insertase
MDILNTSAGKAMLIGLPAISFTFMAFQPGALQLYFLSTGLLGLGQAYIINNAKFRNAMGMAIPIRRQAPEDMSNLEQLQARLAELQANPEKFNKQPEPTNDNNISTIDRVQRNISSWSEKAKREVTDKWSEVRGNSTKNADGSRAAKPRLTEEDRRAAERYEKEANAREAALREERNHARRSAHMRTLAAERQKAQDSFKNLQAVGRDNQARRK